jgi:hypothetical protein
MNEPIQYEKVPYIADCIQWRGDNAEAVIALLPEDAKVSVSTIYLTIRYRGGLTTLVPGWWVARGQNGDVKCYDDATLHVKYRPRVKTMSL